MSDTRTVPDGERATLTRQFLHSEFWLYVLKPEMESQVEAAHYNAVSTPDPTQAWGWLRLEVGLRKLAEEILPRFEKLDVEQETPLPTYGNTLPK